MISYHSLEEYLWHPKKNIDDDGSYNRTDKDSASFLSAPVFFL